MKLALRAMVLRNILCSVIAFLLCNACIAIHAQSPNDEVTPQVQQLYPQAKQPSSETTSATAIQKYRAMLRLAPHLAAAYNNLGCSISISRTIRSRADAGKD